MFHIDFCCLIVAVEDNFNTSILARLHNNVNREVLRLELNSLLGGVDVFDDGCGHFFSLFVFFDMENLTVCIGVHDVGRSDLDADRLERLDLFTFVEESDVDRAHLDSFCAKSFFDSFSVIFCINDLNFQFDAFGEGAFFGVYYDFGAIDGLRQFHFGHSDFFLDGLFLYRQSGLGIDQRSCFRIDDVTGFRID